MPKGIPKRRTLRRLPRTEAQDLAIRDEYGRGDTLVDLQQRYHRGRIMMNSILGLTPATRRSKISQPATISEVQTEAISPMAYVLAFEERTKEFHTIISRLTQERDAAKNEAARLGVTLQTAINGTKADLDQLEAAGKRVASPLGGG